MKLLHIDSSVLGDHSVSRILSAEIVGRLVAADAGLQTAYRDVAADPLPHYVPGIGDQDVAGRDEAVLAEYIDADIVVIGAPLYNFGVPSGLKAWLDRILIAGRTFKYGADGSPVGLVPGKRIILAIARGGIYAKGSPFEALEHGETHLRTAFGFLGIYNCEAVVAEGLAVSPEHREQSIAAARVAVAALPLVR